MVVDFVCWTDCGIVWLWWVIGEVVLVELVIDNSCDGDEVNFTCTGVLQGRCDGLGMPSGYPRIVKEVDASTIEVGAHLPAFGVKPASSVGLRVPWTDVVGHSELWLGECALEDLAYGGLGWRDCWLGGRNPAEKDGWQSARNNAGCVVGEGLLE